ncbi:MAG: energy-coupling factor transporter ATPase [Solobacterium sp.]|nr:energy-coupling factor transporter ATPase [Erysipelotrichaceae bacterium]MCI6701569.1 energy-coupling factor transporter ATPase [Solobacterium sp.]MDD6122600.1 energy-coupling factor transporter ATPase [Solobacterium sp.]MDD6834645.1 energy-coupling factor transporter ATPase [Solobacterium sp.]MDD6886801.1 energy-coupling factor transporter ATPase [Solobacterium sp.]
MAISFQKITYIYDAGMPYAHAAINDIDLELEEGKITAIIGETGSGKSTLVQHLNALLLPNKGRLVILDHEIESDKKNRGLKSLRKDVGLVFQFSEYQLFEETILKDVAFGPKNFGDDEETALNKAKKALKLVGIPESYYERSPLELSGGQKRRVAIAGIIAIEPKILVLDEPTAGLDPAGAMEMINLFISLNKNMGTTIIIVSHDNEVVYNYADNVVLMADGSVRYSGDTLSLFNNDELVKQFNLLEPRLVKLKRELREKGFKINDDVRTLPELAKVVAREVKK